MASSNQKAQRSEHGIHDMISKLTDRLVSLGQGTPEHGNNHHAQHDLDQGVKLITLAGENKGAAMKATNLDELLDTQGVIYNGENLMSAYANSNYQAVNNSIMLEGRCDAYDPGVHIVISDNVDDDSSSDDSSSDDSDSNSEKSDDEDRKGKKGKKKESKKKKQKKKEKKEKKEVSKREHHSESGEEEKKKEKEKKEISKREHHSESEEEEKKKEKKEKKGGEEEEEKTKHNE